jgi:hypothetical protein
MIKAGESYVASAIRSRPLRMSASGGGADVLATWPESPFLAKTRHSLPAAILEARLG